jgi:aspartate aminotransferase
MTQTVSQRAAHLIGSEIIKLAGEINDRIAAGEKIHNLTIGDFNPNVFPIPELFRDEVMNAYMANQTNYPPANGIKSLLDVVSQFIKVRQGLEYPASQYLIAGGGRPLIYACYQALVDEEDKVLFPVPSWNNNHYTYLSGGESIMIETTAETNFMPTAAQLEPHISEVVLVALCSPLNPTGTVFSREGLLEICQLIITENNKRKASEKRPVYMLFDQIYWQLTFGGVEHVDPVSLVPEMRDYTIFVDGLSKSIAATGIRVGWAMGPKNVIDKMKTILGHVGAWSPKPEQVASARFLSNDTALDDYMADFKKKVFVRLEGLYEGFQALKNEGLPIDVISPQAAIYLTARFPLKGFRAANGTVISSTQDITAYLLNEAHVAVVPFYAFGASNESDWYRVSVGTLTEAEISGVVESIGRALRALQLA